MEQFFASLSKRQTMLLLTAVTFGGNEAVTAFDHLPEADAELLKHRAQELLQIPREKRIPLLVQEIKRVVTARRASLWAADPEALAQLLAKERAALVEVVLRALPSHLAEAVRQRLPKHKVELLREVRPDVLNIIRWKLEELLTKAASGRSVFKFSDLLTLQGRELLTVCDRMGARSLATAFAGLPQAEREALFGKLPPDQKDLAQRASAAGESRKLPEEDARKLLEAHGAVADPSAGLRSAGAQRVARACLAQSPEFAARVAERHRGDFGQLFIRWIREERQRTPKGDGGRADIVEQLERLAQKGIIDRPVRSFAPARKPPPAPARGAAPSGQPQAPARRPSSSGFPSAPSGRLPPPPRIAELPAAPPRDRIAEREARRAGVAPRASGQPRRDPIAEREARRAGLPVARPPSEDTDRARPPFQEPPPRAGPPPRRAAAPTSVERPSRAPARTPPTRPPRGPRGGSR